MRRVLTWVFVLAAAGTAEARGRALMGRAREIQTALDHALSGVSGAPVEGAKPAVRKFVASARRAWAELPDRQREEKELSVYRVNEGQIEAAMFDKSGSSRRAGVSSLASAVEHLDKLSDVPIGNVVPQAYLSRLQRRWRSVGFAEAKKDLRVLRGQALAAHIDRVEAAALAGAGSSEDKRELSRQLDRLRHAIGGLVRPNGQLDKVQLEVGIGVVQYLFRSPLTQAHNDLTNAVSQRFFFLRSVAYAFPGERVD